MLLQLTINNFALIEKASLDFKEGFTILSGETGAGKSISYRCDKLCSRK